MKKKFKSNVPSIPEIELETYEREETDAIKEIIFHDSLEDVVFNQLMLSMELDYNLSVLSADPNHPSFMCTISDKNGRRVQAIGESCPRTLLSQVAQDYPVLIASQRAFDRAVLRYLALPGKVFSDLEIPQDADMTSMKALEAEVRKNMMAEMSTEEDGVCEEPEDTEVATETTDSDAIDTSEQAVVEENVQENVDVSPEQNKNVTSEMLIKESTDGVDESKKEDNTSDNAKVENAKVSNVENSQENEDDKPPFYDEAVQQEMETEKKEKIHGTDGVPMITDVDADTMYEQAVAVFAHAKKLSKDDAIEYLNKQPILISGKSKSTNWTIGQYYEGNIGYLEYLMKMAKPSRPITKEIIDILNYYFSLRQ